MSVELPKDADGREIPLDTKVLYDGNGDKVDVSRYQFYPNVGSGYWNIKSVRNKYYRVDEVYLTPVVVLCADGKPVCVGDTVYCDDSPDPLTVNSFTVSECDSVCVQTASDGYYTVPARRLTHERPDNWEKLLEDLDNAAKGGDNAECLYMRREDIEVGEQCSGCRLYNADDVFSDCSLLAYADIADRIRKLRGDDDA